MVSLGCQIAKFRKKRGLKQEELAEMVSLSTSYISAIERGVKKSDAGEFYSHCECSESLFG